VVQNPPGVYTRWYDGTTQRIDKFYPDGKLQSTTVYGDDGKTVLILAEVTDAGAIVHSKVRREDGKVEEKRYSDDGKILLKQTIWVGDGSYFLARREFFPDGKLQ
jgi:antitoxin component YwqK of YwqJK toxin-antitoxin module